MSKYIDAEKLKEEIKRQLSAHDNVDHLEVFEVGKAWNRGHRVALENILSFIDSLQQKSEEESDLQDAEVIFSGYALHTDATKWSNGYKLKIRIYDDN